VHQCNSSPSIFAKNKVVAAVAQQPVRLPCVYRQLSKANFLWLADVALLILF
jgi:hypothetical protein